MKLFKFQREGVQFLLNNRGCMLCDSMGLGKTVQAVIAMDLLFKNNIIEKVVIFCPNTIKVQWQKAIQLWAKTESTVVCKAEDILKPGKIYITNYEKMISLKFYEDVKNLVASSKCLVILDEAQYIKGHRTNRGTRVRSLKGKYKWILTGTPIMNNPTELYNINAFLGNGIFPSFRQFKNEYIDEGIYGQIVGFRNLATLRKKISPILLRRTRDSIDADFPTKTKETISVRLNKEEKEVYSEISNMLGEAIVQYENGELMLANVFMIYMAYKQVCDDAKLLLQSQSTVARAIRQKFDLTLVESSKFAELGRIIDGLDGKVVVFTQFKDMARQIAKRYNGCILTSDNSSDANTVVSQFRNSNTKVFVMTTAAKYGLDGLQVADYMIMYDMLWNPKEMEQIEDRIVRLGLIGQHKTIIKLIIEDEFAIEKRIQRVLTEKEDMIKQVIGD